MARTPDPFLTDPDVDARRHELSLYFAPNPAPFLKDYDRMRAQAVARRTGAWLTLRGAGMCWSAFFFGPVWFFYRRLHGLAWTVVAVLALAGALNYVSIVSISGLGLPFSMALAVTARHVALQRAFRRLGSLHRDGQLSDAAILKAGGVSRPAAWISGTILALLFALALAGIVLAIIHHEPVPN